MWETVFFWIFAAGAVLSSLAVVLIPRNAIYNALALILDFFFLAGIYGLLSAHFLAVTQVLVYGGAIMVVFMFIIMLLNVKDANEGAIRIQVHHFLAVAAAFSFLGLVLGSLASLQSTPQDASQIAAEAAPGQPIVVQASSSVPGLYSSLNEAGLNQRYGEVIQSYAEEEWRPADGQHLPGSDRIYPKYREFDRSQKVVVPPALLPAPESHVADRDPDPFGTIEPLSILLVNRFVISFELTAILLLAAVIGAFIIAKKRL